MRVAIYGRFSSELQNPRSAEDQIARCREFATEKGWEVVGVYKDEARSGRLFTSRSGIQRLLMDVQRGCVDLVVAEALDRFSRDAEHTCKVYKLLLYHGASLFTLAEGAITLMHIGVKGTMNAMYIQDLSVRTRNGQATMIKEGRVAGGPAYGYRSVERAGPDGTVKRGFLEIVPDEADIIREIFERYVSDESPLSIARQLNERGVPTARGGQWTPSTIYGHKGRASGILNNPLYNGILLWSRTEYRRDPLSEAFNVRVRPPSERVKTTVEHLRIVPKELWVRAKEKQEIYGKPSISRRRRLEFWSQRRPKYILSGKLVCAKCGARFTIVGRGEYGCAAHHHRGTCDFSLMVPRPELEAAVFKEIATHISSAGLEARFADVFERSCIEAQKQISGQRKKLLREKQDIERKIGRLVTAIERGVDFEQVQQRLVASEQRSREIDSLLEVEEQDQEGNVVYGGAIETLKLLWEPQNTPENSAAKEAFRALIDRIVLDEDRLTIYLAALGLLKLTAKVPPGHFYGQQIKLVAGAGFEPATFRL